MGIEKPPSKTLNPPPSHGLGKTTVGEMHMLLQHVDAQMSFELTHRQTHTHDRPYTNVTEIKMTLSPYTAA